LAPETGANGDTAMTMNAVKQAMRLSY